MFDILDGVFGIWYFGCFASNWWNERKSNWATLEKLMCVQMECNPPDWQLTIHPKLGNSMFNDYSQCCHVYWNVICISEIIIYWKPFYKSYEGKVLFRNIQAILFKFQLLGVTGSRLAIIWIWIINRSEGSMKTKIIFAHQPSRLVLRLS